MKRRSIKYLNGSPISLIPPHILQWRYWLLSDGKKIGFQAKYFTRTGDINWSQVDNSVRQAIDTHPELTRYIVAFACDFTDRSGTKKKGLTGWKHWENHKAQWNKWASEKGLSIEFEPWTKSDIVERLILPENKGLIEYWFNTLERPWGNRQPISPQGKQGGGIRKAYH